MAATEKVKVLAIEFKGAQMSRNRTEHVDCGDTYCFLVFVKRVGMINIGWGGVVVGEFAVKFYYSS